MLEIQTSEVDAKHAPVMIELTRVKFNNHGNQAIVVWQFEALIVLYLDLLLDPFYPQ
jgi:hypothetical protein